MPRTAALLESAARKIQWKGETRTSPVFDCIFVPDILVVVLKLWESLAKRSLDRTSSLIVAPLTAIVKGMKEIQRDERVVVGVD